MQMTAENGDPLQGVLGDDACNIDPRPRFGAAAPLVRIGVGRCGPVYRATDSVTGQEVAIKELAVPGSRSGRDRIAREVGLLRHLRQVVLDDSAGENAAGRGAENLLAFRAAFYFASAGADRKVWLVSELAVHGTLYALLSRIRLTERQLSVVLRQLLSALQFLHERAGILHRDVKSDNCLVHGDRYRIVLGDFGNAVGLPGAGEDAAAGGQDRKSQRRSRRLVGTPHWIAPEVILGEGYSPQSDVWAAGVVLHELITGEPVAWELSREAVMQRTASGTIDLSRVSGTEALEAPTDGTTVHVGHAVSEACLGFLKSLLQVDRSKRPSASQALSHPFIAQYSGDGPEVLESAVKRASLG